MTIHRILRKLSREQKIAITLSRSVSATCSVIASSIIIYKIYLRYKAQSKSTVGSGSFRSSSINDSVTTYHRMLLTISILDFFHSISSAFSTLAVPSYTNGTFARGTIATCAVQGALAQATTSIVIYMAMLNFYFMLKIRYNVSESVIKRRYEIWLHGIPFLHFFGTIIIGLSMGIFGPIILPEIGCWLDSFCAYTNTCTRSGPIFYENVDFFAWSFAYIWLFICVVVVVINAVLIYTAIRSQEKRNEKYLGAKLQKEGPSHTTGTASHPDVKQQSTRSANLNSGTDEGNKNIGGPSRPCELEESGIVEDTEFSEISIMFSVPQTSNDDIVPVTTTNKTTAKSTIKQSRIAAVQSSLYVSSALFSAIWIFMPWLGYKLQVASGWRFFFAFMVNFVAPSQGMFNLFIFVRLHYLRLRESNENWSRWYCVKVCLFSSD